MTVARTLNHRHHNHGHLTPTTFRLCRSAGPLGSLTTEENTSTAALQRTCAASQATRRDFQEDCAVVAVEVANVGEAGRDALDQAPLPNRLGVEGASIGEQLGTIADEAFRVAGEQRLVVLAHRHAQIVGALGADALGIDELERAESGLDSVPAVSVAVHEHGIGWIDPIAQSGFAYRSDKRLLPRSPRNTTA